MHCTAGRRREHYPIGIGTELGKGEGKTTLSLSSLGLASSVNDDCPCSTFLGNFGLAAAAAANTNRGEKLSYPLLSAFLPYFLPTSLQLHSLRRLSLSIQVMSTLRERGAYSICIKSLSLPSLLFRPLSSPNSKTGPRKCPLGAPLQGSVRPMAASERISK